MKTKYRINTQKRDAGASLAAEVVTVPRVAACFPVRILQFIEMGVGRIIIDKAELTAGPIPKWLLHPAAASVLPVKTSSARAARLIIVTFGMCVLTDNLLHKKDGKYTPFVSILAYLEAARQTAAVPDKARSEFLRVVKIYKKAANDKNIDGDNMLDLDPEQWQDATLSLIPNGPRTEAVKEWISKQVATDGNNFKGFLYQF